MGLILLGLVLIVGIAHVAVADRIAVVVGAIVAFAGSCRMGRRYSWMRSTVLGQGRLSQLIDSVEVDGLLEKQMVERQEMC